MRSCPAKSLCSRVTVRSHALRDGEEIVRFLEALYARFNRRQMVHPDPLEFLYGYWDPRDRELVGLVAAALAYGRVAQILKSVGDILARLGPRPRQTVMEVESSDLENLMGGFRHRFTTGMELAGLLKGAARIIREHGSLGDCLSYHLRPGDCTILPALCAWIAELDSASLGIASKVLASPSRGSSCKRLHLYLRWMVRRDQVDPGGWDGISPSLLVVPLDVHMHRVGVTLGFTQRKQADLLTAMEITDGFRSICFEDPVKYDFVLTRPGIWGQGESFWEERRSSNGIPKLQRPDRW